MSVDDLQKVFKKLHGRKTDDWVDKLNHAFTVMILLAFAVIISAKQFVGEPIHCWNPPEYSGVRESYDKYIHDYCWVKNTYFIPFEDLTVLPVDVLSRTNAEITYYQWAPLILVFMAFLFKFPHFVWKILNTNTGLNISRLCSIADECICAKPDDRKERIGNAVIFMDKWLTSMKFSFSGRLFKWLTGRYLSMLYLAIKSMYMANVIGQLFLMSAFLNLNYSFGIDFVSEMVSGDVDKLRMSQRFPRVTMCDFEIRKLQNVQRYTVQCVLPINLFNEKIFTFLWFWLIIVAVLSFLNLLKWVHWMFFKKSNYVFVKKYLKITEKVNTATEKNQCRKFAESYIRDDGCFVLRMIAHNSSDVVVIDMVTELWKKFTMANTFDTNG